MKQGTWKLGLGATVIPGGTAFRVWAPASKRVEAVIAGRLPVRLRREGPSGYFSGVAAGVRAGMDYRYRLDGADYPDPCSRFQPEGPFGPSRIVDPAAFRWTDQRWPGVERAGQVLYEIHIGTFTREGTFDAARQKLAELHKTGITLLEIMPVSDWAGSRNWGYDGVDFFAPSRCYGDAEAFKRFVDAAHALGLGVLLDVVYNHFGPDGNFLPKFSPYYVSRRHPSEWGPVPNFDGPRCGPVREFFLQNACYWIAEFHLDGLRLDATQSIADDSRVHVLDELSRRTREAAGTRPIVLMAENEPQHAHLVRPRAEGGYELDALWNDDFHHAARVALTGFREAYFTDYRGTAPELLAAALRGFLFQGQYYSWQKKPRGTPALDLPAQAFVFYLQNHDQVANHFRGVRPQRLGPPGVYRALTSLLLLSPSTPLLFMGQEFESSSPFVFFADHAPRLAPLVDKGRRSFFVQFPSYRRPEAQRRIPSAASKRAFERAKIDWNERRTHAPAYRMHRDLLALRRRFALGHARRSDVAGAALSDDVLVLRYKRPRGRDLLVAVNLGRKYESELQPEPLLAPAEGRKWTLIWSSQFRRYGGPGARPLRRDRWVVPRETAFVLESR